MNFGSLRALEGHPGLSAVETFPTLDDPKLYSCGAIHLNPVLAHRFPVTASHIREKGVVVGERRIV